MDKGKIDYWIREGKLRKRLSDKPRIKSLIESAQSNANILKNIPITEDNATLIFREYYECIRQLGDARWWSLGYEPRASHEVSMEILMDMNISNSYKMRNLDRFRRIRNNANYRGYKVSREEAKEIVDLWISFSKEIINKIKESLRS